MPLHASTRTFCILKQSVHSIYVPAVNLNAPHSYETFIGAWLVHVMAHRSAVCMLEQQHGLDVNVCVLFILEKWTFTPLGANMGEFVNVGGALVRYL